jgi:prevent-host-death family protein
MRRVTATELQRNAREVIDRVRVRHEAVVVENRGKPMVAVVPYEEYVRYSREREARFERLFRAAEANARLNGDLTEEEAMALVDEVRQEIWDEQHPPATP